MAQKRKNLTGRRLTLRNLMCVHRGYLDDMIGRLEGGCRLGPWVDDMARNLKAAPETLHIVMTEPRGRPAASGRP